MRCQANGFVEPTSLFQNLFFSGCSPLFRKHLFFMSLSHYNVSNMHLRHSKQGYLTGVFTRTMYDRHIPPVGTKLHRIFALTLTTEVSSILGDGGRRHPGKRI
jgi:hypothetical protein